jgi:hypothetical protein
MRKEVYFCDHCGKEINPMNDYTDFEIDIFDFVKEVDLCQKCFNELSGIIKKFVSK